MEVLKIGQVQSLKEEEVSRSSHPLRHKTGDLFSGEKKTESCDGRIPGVMEGEGVIQKACGLSASLQAEGQNLPPSPPPHLSSQYASGQTDTLQVQD